MFRNDNDTTQCDTFKTSVRDDSALERFCQHLQVFLLS